MFKKMVKLKNKKAFTLIEMLAVIAIVAVLVAVIIPVVTGSTDKAAAATNASSLRGVEGEVISMMLVNPMAFGDKSSEQGKIDADRDEYLTENKELAAAQANLDKANQVLADAKEDPGKAVATIKSLANEEAQAAEQEKSAAQAEKSAAQAEKSQYEATRDSYKQPGCTVICGYTKLTGWCHSRRCKTSDANREQINSYQSKVNEADEKIDAADDKINEANQKITEANLLSFADEDTISKLINSTSLGKTIYNEALNVLQDAVTEAEEEVQRIKNENDAALGELDKLEQELYEVTAVDGYITLADGTKLEAPASKAVKDYNGVTIDKGVQMVVYVNPTTYQAYAYYEDYRAADFAAVAE